MKIKDLPNSSKPRERFLKHGKEALSDAELIAIILRTGTINENVVDMSNRLIKEYSLEKLFDCSLKELQEIKGIGPSKAMQILAISELGKRHNNSRNPIKKITCARDVYEHFKEKLKDEKQENFFVLILNNANNIVKEELVSKGVLDAAILHPREVFKPAIKNSASKIILVHNHPSGNSQPSLDDLEITKQLIEAGKLLDIKVLDHVIIGCPRGQREKEGLEFVKENDDNESKGWWSWVEDE